MSAEVGKEKAKAGGSDQNVSSGNSPAAREPVKPNGGEHHDDPQVARKSVEKKDDESEDLHNSRKKAPAPQRRSKNNQNYSQEFYDDDQKPGKKPAAKISKNPSLGAISAPTDLEDDPEFQAQRDLEIQRAAERKKQNEQFVKASKKPSKSKSRNWTQALGTAKYNPFLVGGTFGSVASSFGSMVGTMRNKNPRKALYADNPLQLQLVKGFYKILREGDNPDDASIASNTIQRKPAKISAMLRKFKKLSNKNRENNRTLSQREIDIINRTARQSHMAELSPEEIQYIEKRLENENIKQKGCYAFITSCFDAIRGLRNEKAKQGEDQEGNDTMITEAKPKSANRKSSGTPRPDCTICKVRIDKKDAFSQASEPKTAEINYFHTECIQCELCRDMVGGHRAMKMKAAGGPVLCESCQREIEETQEAQAELHQNLAEVNDTEYLALTPKGYRKFVPVEVTNPDKEVGLAIIPLCASCGLQFNAKDKDISSRDRKRWHSTCPTGSTLKTRLVSDVKTVALGLPTDLTFRVIGTSGILKNPLTQDFRFVRDNASMQYELRQKIKGGLAIIYNLARDQQNMFFNLDNVKCDSLTFEGAVVENVGPFIAGQKVVKQEETMRKTGNTVMMRGRFEHGILYDWLTKLHYNEKKNTLTPVALELTLRVPSV